MRVEMWNWRRNVMKMSNKKNTNIIKIERRKKKEKKVNDDGSLTLMW